MPLASEGQPDYSPQSQLKSTNCDMADECKSIVEVYFHPTYFFSCSQKSLPFIDRINSSYKSFVWLRRNRPHRRQHPMRLFISMKCLGDYRRRRSPLFGLRSSMMMRFPMATACVGIVGSREHNDDYTGDAASGASGAGSKVNAYIHARRRVRQFPISHTQKRMSSAVKRIWAV